MLPEFREMTVATNSDARDFEPPLTSADGWVCPFQIYPC